MEEDSSLACGGSGGIINSERTVVSIAIKQRNAAEVARYRIGRMKKGLQRL